MGALAVLGFRNGLASVLAAAATASPVDAGAIAVTGTAETSQLVVFGWSLAGALFASSGLALLVAALVQQEPLRRRVFGLLGAGSAALAAWLISGARAEARLVSGLDAAALAAPIDRPALIVAALSERAGLRLFEFASLGAVLLVSLGAALVLRASPRAAAGVVAWLLVAAAGFGGARLLVSVPTEVAELVARSSPVEPLIDLDASYAEPDAFTGLVLGAQLEELPGFTHGQGRCGNVPPTARPPSAEAHAPLAQRPRGERLRPFTAGNSGAILALGLQPDATAAGLDALVREAIDARFQVLAVVGVHTQPTPADVDVPAFVRPMFTTYRALPVLVGREETLCAAPCAFATIDERAVRLPAHAPWPLEERSAGQADLADPAKAVFVRWPDGGLAPSLVLRAAHTAATHDSTLALVLPRVVHDEPTARVDETFAAAKPTVMGALSLSSVTNSVRRHGDEVQRCFDEAKQHGTVEVKFIVNASGAVASSSVVRASIASSGLEVCLVRALRGWRFDKPRDGGLAMVTWPFEG